MGLGKYFALNIFSIFLLLKTYENLEIFISDKKYRENCLSTDFENCDGASRELPLRDMYSAFIKVQGNEELINSN